MRRRRTPGVLAVIIAVVAVIAYVAMSWVVFSAFASVPARCSAQDGMPGVSNNTPASFQTLDAPPVFTPPIDTDPYLMEDYETVSVRARDGVALAAWWVPGASPDAPAVVVVHGLRSCRRDEIALLPAGMLHRNGFAVLLVDMREHGDSTRIDGRYSGGGEETLDVLGAWDWLRERGVPAERIGLLGVSAGGSIVTLAAADEPRVAAAWENSGYASAWNLLDDGLRQNGYPGLLVPGAVLLARLAGIDLNGDVPIDAISRIGSRPVAIVHELDDTVIEPSHGFDLALARERVGGREPAPWFVPGATHARAAFAVPEEYERRLVSFFGGALGFPAVR